ncbi:SEC14-like protein 2 [Musca domestica]|uniref:SEC14-like protein 2 n=1 Tax=Musca domestica TaxID=7370 RepID=A0A1I8NFW9_MUSDO|nr:SEC14-like protein 2 [Musca domestica]
MSMVPELTESQQQTLAEFRKKVSDCLVDNEVHDDYFLLRWLRARKWDVDAAEKMLRNAMKNRISINIDSLDKWEAPEVLRKYLPYGVVGYDKEGSPIIVCPFYQFDIYGMLHCVTRFDFIRYVVKILENVMKQGFEQSKTHGVKARQVVVIFDVADFNMTQYAWRPAVELVMAMIKEYEQNYPEILKMCYIINAPKVFYFAFNFVKKLLDEYTMSKISISKYGSDKWKEAAFSHIDPDIMPKSFGGNLVENGDEKCPSKIVWGGKIPKELYVEQKDDDDKSFIEAIVNKGNKLKLEFDVGSKKPTEEDKLLSWDFRTVDHDIKFGIYSIDNATGEKRSEVPLTKVYSNEMNEVGFITTRPNTKYTVVFDNSGSYLRSKKLRYWVSLISENDDMLTLQSQVGQTEVVPADNN